MDPEELANIITDDPDLFSEAKPRKKRAAKRRARRKKERRRGKRIERQALQPEPSQTPRKPKRDREPEPELPDPPEYVPRKQRKLNLSSPQVQAFIKKKADPFLQKLVADLQELDVSGLRKRYEELETYIDDLQDDFDNDHIDETDYHAELIATYKAMKVARQMYQDKYPEYKDELEKNPPKLKSAPKSERDAVRQKVQIDKAKKQGERVHKKYSKGKSSSIAGAKDLSVPEPDDPLDFDLE